MRQSLFLRSLVIASTLLTLAVAEAQLVGFSGKDSNPADAFAFVALQDIPSSTTFYVTNREWDNSTGSFLDDGEGTLVFTSTSLISKGTVVLVTEDDPTPDAFVVSAGGTAIILAGSAAWSPTSADPHYAFSASNPASPFTTITAIHAAVLTYTATPAGADPTTGTGASPNAVVLDYGAQVTGVDFSADRSTAQTVDLTNPANFLDGASLSLVTTSFSTIPVEVMEFEVD